MQELIIETITTTLTAAAPTGIGLLDSHVEIRKLFEGIIRETKDGKIVLPAKWAPPFALIDDEPSEVATPNGRLYARTVIDVDGVSTRREWRLIHDIEWSPSILLCAKTATDVRTLRDVFTARLPKFITQTVSAVDGSDDVYLAATLAVKSSGLVRAPGFMHEYSFMDLRVRCQYGRYQTVDRAMKKPVTVVPDEEE